MKTHNKSSGVSMVEFAVVLPLLLLILYGVTEIGRALYQQNSLYKGLVTGARYMARASDIITVDTVNKTCAPATGYATVENNTKNLIICGQKSDADALHCETTGADTIVPGLTTAGINISLLAVDDEIFGCIIRIEAGVEFEPLYAPLGGGPGPFAIPAETEERYIGL